MEKRLLKRLELVRTLLSEAALEINHAANLETYREHVARGELELALDCLEGLGAKISPTPDFWWNLKKAAEVMGLKSRYAALRARRVMAQRTDST